MNLGQNTLQARMICEMIRPKALSVHSWKVGSAISYMRLRKESPNLDLLRSVAVLAVLADHVAATRGIAQKHIFLWDLGSWGVLLFFVHTSFVLMMSLERLQFAGQQLYATFYIRRFFRIYPLSIVYRGAHADFPHSV